MRSLIYACNGEVEELVKFLVHVRSLLEIMMEIKQWNDGDNAANDGNGDDGGDDCGGGGGGKGADSAVDDGPGDDGDGDGGGGACVQSSACVVDKR